MSDGLDEFDLNGALLRRSESELRAFMEALAVRLEGALPGHVTVERRREGLLSSTRRVAAITLTGEHAVYQLQFDRSGLKATRVKQVRNVRLSSADISVQEWLADVREELKTLAEQAGTSSDALHGFL